MNSMASVNPFEEIVPESVSSSSAPPPLSSFDVFINHCGADVKFTLATDIRDKLSAAGLSVFLDVDSLQLGDVFPAKIEKAMCAASLHIAIFSAKYAESPWCLAELSFILHTGKTIIPVFKDVQPSDLRWVRAGKGIYAHAFSHYESQRRYSPEKLEEWKVALEKASFLNGIEVKDNKGEGMALKNIVNTVSKILPKAPFLVARKPVGLGDIVLDFERKTAAVPAENEYNVQIVGIVGMGGAGKTTLAKELYNRKSSSFQSSSFVFEVRDAASRKALHEKQKKLMGDLGLQSSTFDNIEEGKAILATRLRSVHALIVLDDVDHENQVDALLPGKDCLAAGSLVIVTTRERHLLAKWVSTTYEMKGLKHFHAKELFCWHAFLQSYPEQGFEDIVEKFLKACDRLPLSLEVFGGLVYGRTEDFWESQLDKISRVLPEDIKGRLKVSYHSLDEEEQEMFMDVACFFIHKELSLAIELWNGSGWSGLQGWETLVNKCLVNVDGQNYIRMHDHLRDLGRDLAGKQTHSRVWLPEQIMSIEKQARGGRSIRGIDAAAAFTHEPLSRRQRRKKMFEVIGTSNRCFGRPPPSSLGLKLLTDREDRVIKDLSTQLEEPICLMLDHFLRRKLESWSLRRLRILELTSPDYLRKLWDDSDPPLQLRHLTINRASKLQRIPASIGRLTELKRIDLDNCASLKNLPEEFCGLRSVEWLNLRLCSMLPSLPRRFGDLINLRHVDLSLCIRLQVLPDSFKQLRHLSHLDLSCCWELAFRSDMLESIGNLEYLNFNGCGKLEQLPNQITHQVFLRELNVKDTGIREVPSDIGELRKLEVLEIGSPFLASLPSSLGNLSSLSRLSIRSIPLLTNLPFSFENFSRLTELHLSKCEMLNSLPDIVGPLSMLKMIELTSTAVSTISVTEDSCPNLESLTLCYNDHLVDIQTLPTSLRRLKVENSKMLKKIKGLRGLANLQSLHIGNCPELNEIPSFGDLHPIKEVRIGECNNLMKIEGLENSKALETLDVEKWEGIQSLEGMEKLKNLRMIAENRSALQPCIQTIRKWPGEMWICGRAVSGAKSIMNSLSFPALTVATSLKKISSSQWKVECGKTHVSDAVLACFLINSFQDKCVIVCPIDRVVLFDISGWYEGSRARLQEGKWVYVGVRRQGCGFSDSGDKFTAEVRFNGAAVGKVEKGILVAGEEGRVLEAFAHFWPLFI